MDKRFSILYGIATLLIAFLPFFKMMDPASFELVFFNLYQILLANWGITLIVGVLLVFLRHTQPGLFGRLHTVPGIITMMLGLWVVYGFSTTGSLQQTKDLLGIGYWLLLLINITIFCINNRKQLGLNKS